MYPLWAFLLGSGLRIGEVVWLSWKDVDLDRGLVRIVQFASTLGYELAPSAGKSKDAVRTIDPPPASVAWWRASGLPWRPSAPPTRLPAGKRCLSRSSATRCLRTPRRRLREGPNSGSSRPRMRRGGVRGTGEYHPSRSSTTQRRVRSGMTHSVPLSVRPFHCTYCNLWRIMPGFSKHYGQYFHIA